MNKSAWIEVTAESTSRIAQSWQTLSNGVTLLFLLTGDRMSTTETMFSEFARVLRFPDYFGGNWGAFDECLADLEWLGRFRRIVLLIEGASALLADEDEHQRNLLLEMLARQHAEWSAPMQVGGGIERPAAEFQVILQDDDPRRLVTWRSAAALLPESPS